MFFRYKETFPLKLITTYSNLVRFIFVSRIKTYIFSLYLIPPELLVEYSYFHGNVVICLSSIRICSLYYRTQLEISIILPQFDWNTLCAKIHKIKYDQRDFCLFFIFNWRIIALQCCVGFCHTTWISHKYTYIPSLLNLSPTPYPIPPL